MKNLAWLAALGILLIAGCDSTGSRPEPKIVDQPEKTTEEALANVPPDMRDSVRQTIEANRSRPEAGSSSYAEAMRGQGKGTPQGTK